MTELLVAQKRQIYRQFELGIQLYLTSPLILWHFLSAKSSSTLSTSATHIIGPSLHSTLRTFICLTHFFLWLYLSTIVSLLFFQFPLSPQRLYYQNVRLTSYHTGPHVHIHNTSQLALFTLLFSLCKSQPYSFSLIFFFHSYLVHFPDVNLYVFSSFPNRLFSMIFMIKL